MAFSPPSASWRRTATSASFVPRTSSAARCSGDLPAITFSSNSIVARAAASSFCSRYMLSESASSAVCRSAIDRRRRRTAPA